VTTLTQY